MVLLGFPAMYDLDVITSHPKVLRVSRLTKGKIPTRQVLVTLRGAHLGPWTLEMGHLHRRTYVPEPARRLKC